ncbi:MAG: SET domain-containing protein-lysine N-methyltransferase [Bdellovibrionales bacterium]|nr:SET domain-containing protein-lysine N-methyltransferase [Bdellovibrionales bacterium]
MRRTRRYGFVVTFMLNSIARCKISSYGHMSSDRLELIIPTKIELRTSTGKGRGVFATDVIEEGEIIERFPTIVLSEVERAFVKSQPEVLYYYYLDMLRFDVSVIMLGYGSLYNHSKTPNSEFRVLNLPNMMEVYALRRIEEGEEIVYDYNFDDGREEFLNLT